MHPDDPHGPENPKSLPNKLKIFNDPIYGFISIPDELIFDIIEHPYFQRLRRIKQLGLTHLVYPGALHTRFHHALGAMHLMGSAVETLRMKGHEITEEEYRGAMLAILLHDIGHGPFSHALENSIVEGISHEEFSGLFMERLNGCFDHKLKTAIRIFRDEHPKRFLHQLVASQLDMDRLDYLKRDSFYSGVSEGVISSDRIIAMLNVRDDMLVAESKAIYSIEKFIVARRLMYWQVYYHKTVLAAEYMLLKILRRAKILAEQGVPLFSTPSLALFLQNRFSREDFIADPGLLEAFSKLDDFDVFTSIKVWAGHPDKILADLCRNLVDRHLFRIEMQNAPFEFSYVDRIRENTARKLGIALSDTEYYVIQGEIANNAYNPKSDRILILDKKGGLADIADSSDQLNVSVLSDTVTRFFLCYPKFV